MTRTTAVVILAQNPELDEGASHEHARQDLRQLSCSVGIAPDPVA